MYSQDKEFTDESFQTICASGKHECFELARLHYHCDRMESTSLTTF
jgi:hypothetical protein